MSINLQNFVTAFCSGFGKSSEDETEVINDFNKGIDVAKKYGSCAIQIVDAYCFLQTYLSLPEPEQKTKESVMPSYLQYCNHAEASGFQPMSSIAFNKSIEAGYNPITREWN